MCTSVFFREASATHARESRKSPASTATCVTIKFEKELLQKGWEKEILG